MSKQPRFAAKTQSTPPALPGNVKPEDFRALLSVHKYIFLPCRTLWPAASIDAVLPPQVLRDANGNPVKARNGKIKTEPMHLWLDRNLPAHGVTWAPGLPMIIHDRLAVESGWIEYPGGVCVNFYREPQLPLGDANAAQPWLDHVAKLYPVKVEADHIIRWLAQRVQSPEIKINHALVLGGDEGIGKDTLLEPVKRTIGVWNFREASPTQVMGRFNGFAKATILRINEARDLGEANRFKFYDHLKVFAAAPPDMLRIDEKHVAEYDIVNCVGIIIGTNYKTDGIYLAEQDRRHFVAWSELTTKADFPDGYFRKLWHWFDHGGAGHVAAYLMAFDLSDFNAKAPPPKTEAWWAIVNANLAPEEDELRDAIDKLGNPDAFIVSDLVTADPSLDWLYEPKSRRAIPYRLERCSYVRVDNPDRQRSVWMIKDRSVPIYARKTLNAAERLNAAQKLFKLRNET